MAWEHFKAHSGGAGREGSGIAGGDGAVAPGPSLLLTVRAAATATSLAVEHLRKRSRNRLLLEKGAGSVRRLSGPLQITLEDLKVGCVVWCGGGISWAVVRVRWVV